MRLGTRAKLCLMSLALCGSTLVAQTFTFSQPKSIVTLPPYTGFYMNTLDLNGDGKIDLAVQIYATQMSVYLGNGTGGFSTTPVVANTWDPGATAPPPMFIDVNGDGFADQVWGYDTYNDPANFITTNGQFIVALGDGKGHFTMTTSLGSIPPGAGSGDPLVAADFNGDGKVDFALLTGGGEDLQGNNLPAEITLFLNQGNGKFAQQNSIKLSTTGAWAMVAGDFNGDGKQDLAWAQSNLRPSTGPYPITYMYGNGDGTFGTMRNYWTDTVPIGLASADLNGDHKTDLVVSLSPVLDQYGNPVSGSNWRIATLLAKQADGFYWASAVSSTTPTQGLKLMDLNNDGHVDAIYNGIYLRAGLAGGAFGPHQIVTGQTPPPNVYDYANLPFAPLVKGGLPAFFSSSVDSSQNEHLNVQLNLSK